MSARRRASRKRVASYAKPGAQTNRIARMISETAEMIFVSTASEIEALLLEANLIKRLKPRYNVSYRDDKSFPNILLRTDHPFPQVLKHRGAKSRDGIYFGPFAAASAVNMTLNTLQRAFLLAVVFGLRCSRDARGRACSIRSSAAARPARAASMQEHYAALVAQANEFLTGKSRLRAGPTRRADARRIREAWTSSAPRNCATASAP